MDLNQIRDLARKASTYDDWHELARQVNDLDPHLYLNDDDYERLRGALADADTALEGDSNDAEHDALYALAEEVRGLLTPPPEEGKPLTQELLNELRKPGGLFGPPTWPEAGEQ